jgi:anti-anti-sigma regulatory factor
MLRITRTVLSKQEIVLHLHGRLSGLWAELLQRVAESVLDQNLVLTIDLTNISYVDCEGITVLMKLLVRGARDVNAPLFVAEQIRKCKDLAKTHFEQGSLPPGGAS